MTLSINDRIAKIIEIKSGGSQKAFAEQFGWSAQYVGKLVRDGGSVGIEPVRRILEQYEDIDGRWLVTGKGEMIDQGRILEIKTNLYNNIRTLLDLEKYLPYMSDDELLEYKKSASGLQEVRFDAKQLARWQSIMHEKENELSVLVKSAKSPRRRSDAK